MLSGQDLSERNRGQGRRLAMRDDSAVLAKRVDVPVLGKLDISAGINCVAFLVLPTGLVDDVDSPGAVSEDKAAATNRGDLPVKIEGDVCRMLGTEMREDVSDLDETWSLQIRG